LLACGFLVVFGCVVFALDISRDTKYFLSGVLLGAAAGGGLSEFSALAERREDNRRFVALREDVLAKCRVAYTMGDFRTNAVIELNRGILDRRSVGEFLNGAKRLGFPDTFAAEVTSYAKAEPSSGAPSIAKELATALAGKLDTQVRLALSYLGRDLNDFYTLGATLYELRFGLDQGDAAQIRNRETAERLASLLDVAQAYAYLDLTKAWRNLGRLMSEGSITDGDVKDVVEVFYTYLLTLGLRSEQDYQFESMLGRLARLGSSGRFRKRPGPLIAEIKAAAQRLGSASGVQI
jgi:hypothetical protein